AVATAAIGIEGDVPRIVERRTTIVMERAEHAPGLGDRRQRAAARRIQRFGVVAAEGSKRDGAGSVDGGNSEEGLNNSARIGNTDQRSAIPCVNDLSV